MSGTKETKAIASQTFHYEKGTVWAGTKLDVNDPLVKKFWPLFDMPEGVISDQPVDDQEEDEPDDNYDEQPVSVLRSLAKQRRLDQGGTKADLIDRLRDYDAK